MITLLKPGKFGVWDTYVRSHSNGSFFHLTGWKTAVEEAYGLTSLYLLAERDGAVTGVLPVFHLKSLLFGSYLISVPFGIYGGPLADDPETGRQLAARALELGRELKADYVQLRNTVPGDFESFAVKPIFVTSHLEIGPDYGEVKKIFSKNKRSTINKSMKRDLVLDRNCPIEDFYDIYLRNMKRLGTPQHSLAFFRILKKTFPDTCTATAAVFRGKPVYAGIFLRYNHTVLDCWSSALPEYRNLYCTDFAISHEIEQACRDGFGVFDFGRSMAGSANLEFKRRWGAEERPLYYSYALFNASKKPMDDNSDNSRGAAVNAWKKLPLPLVRLLGPAIRKYIP